MGLSDSLKFKVLSTRGLAFWAAVAMLGKRPCKYKMTTPLLFVQEGNDLAFSPGTVLETPVCKRASGVAWFFCVGASLNPAGG